MVKEKKKESLLRELAEWGIVVMVILVLYLTGLHVVILGSLQSLVLKTGLFRPDIHSAVNLGQMDYNFRLMDRDGKSIDVSAFRGKVIFINFWATWCPPCVAEMPDINRLYQKVKSEDFIFLMISVDEDFSKARHFADKRNFSLPIYTPLSAVPAVLESRVVPSTYIVAPDGRIAAKREGMARYNSESFLNFLKNLR